MCRQEPKQTTGPQTGKSEGRAEEKRPWKKTEGGRDGRWRRFFWSALFIFKYGKKKRPQVAQKPLHKECDPLETSHQWSPLNSTRTLIAFRAFFSSGFHMCENLPLCHEPRQTLGPGFSSSGPPARRIWHLLKIEKRLYFFQLWLHYLRLFHWSRPHTVSRSETIPLVVCITHYLNLRVQNCGLFPAKDAQIRTLLDL